MRLINNTDETVIIEPGESLDLSGELDEEKIMTSRKKRFYIGGKED